MKTLLSLAILSASLGYGSNLAARGSETLGLNTSTAVHVQELVALVVPQCCPSRIVGGCKLKIHDGDGLPVSGVQATIAWSGARTGTGTGTTDANGRVDILFSDKGACKKPYVDYVCTIQDLSKAGYTYDSAANVVNADGDDCRF